MNTPPKVPLKLRILALVGPWLIAGVVYATCAKLNLEGGENVFGIRAQMVGFAPLIAAQGLAYTVVPGDYNAWHGRQLWETAAAWTSVSIFLVLAVMLLTLRSRRQFAIWSLVQIGLVLLSIPAVLYFFYRDATSGP